MTMTPAATRILADLRYQLLDPATQLRRKTDTDALADPRTVGAVA